MQAVVVTDLCRSYCLQRAISNVNFTIAVGEIFGFLGPNGSGTSTLVKHTEASYCIPLAPPAEPVLAKLYSLHARNSANKVNGSSGTK